MFPPLRFRRIRSCGRPACCFVLLAGGLALLLAPGCGSITASARNAEGVRLFQQARYPEALQQFQEATYTDPSNPDGYYNLAATYHRMGRVETRPSYLEQAEQYYNMALDECERQSTNPRECYRGLATLLAEQGRTDEAMRLMRGWADSDPLSADARIELARLCEEFGDKAAAKEHLTAALSLDPENDRALTALGKLREDAGEHAQALAAYERSLWHNQFQPEVAARVAALRSGTSPWAQLPETSRDTRLVERDTEPLR